MGTSIDYLRQFAVLMSLLEAKIEPDSNIQSLKIVLTAIVQEQIKRLCLISRELVESS